MFRRITAGFAALALVALVACQPPGETAIHVDPSPNFTPGFTTVRIRPAASWNTKTASDGVGAFRTNCSASHLKADDPIVFPGQTFITHFHTFFGNTSANGNSTHASLSAATGSTCTGGLANRSAYWAPTLLDTTNPEGHTMVPMWGVNALQVYYKSGYKGVNSIDVVQFPQGLKIIAGSKSTPPFQPSSHAQWYCDNNGYHYGQGTVMPQCGGGHRLVLSITFPQCWDGVNLDSPDHRSHMAYGQWGQGGCIDPDYPVALPELTQNFRWPVPAGGNANWRLSSDLMDPSAPAGVSAHADFWFAWDEEVGALDDVLENCFRGNFVSQPGQEKGWDCHMNLLGDGRELH